MDIPLDEVIYVEAVATSSTGAAVDADSTPTFAIYEEATDTDIGVGGNMTKRTSLTGNYRASFTASAANGFELGKWYSVIGSATIGSVATKGVLKTFRIVAAENTAGYPVADTVKINGTSQTAKDLGAINVTNLNTLSGHDPGATLGTSTLTQSQVTGGAYALNSASFAFNAALDFTTTQKAATIAGVTTATNLTNAPTSGDFTSTMKNSIGTAVAASAVASVTGNVGGNVTGSVGSVLGGIDTTSGTVKTLDAAIAALATAHGAGSWEAATGFAVPGDAMTLTSAYDAAKTAATQTSVDDLNDFDPATETVNLHSDYDAAKTASQAGDAMTLEANERNAVADALLARNIAGGSSTGRTVSEALAKLRNKWDIYDNAGTPTLRVYATNDATVLWEEVLSSASSGDVITGADPS